MKQNYVFNSLGIISNIHIYYNVKLNIIAFPKTY